MYQTISGLKFSTDGSLLIAYSSSKYSFIVVIESLTGIVKSARILYDSIGIFHYNKPIKSMLISSAPSPMAYILCNYYWYEKNFLWKIEYYV